MIAGAGRRHVPPGAGALVLFALLALAACHPSPVPAPTAGPRPTPTATPAALGSVPVATSAPAHPGSREASGPTLRIGAIFNLGTDGGPAARAGWESARLAVDVVNAAGGALLPDGSRRPLELLVYDDDGVPDRTALALRSLVEEDRVLAVLGPTDPESARAAAAAVERAATPLIALSSLRNGGRASDTPRWSFSLALSDERALGTLVDYLVAGGADRFGWIAPRTAHAVALRATLTGALAGRDRELVAETSYALGDRDLAERVLGLAQAGAQHIIGWPRDAGEGAELARAAAQVTPRARLYLGPGAASESFLTLAGPAATGVRVVGIRLLAADQLWEGEPVTARVLEFARAYRDRYGRPPAAVAAPAWDAVRLLVQALERAGPDRAGLRDAVESTFRFSGATGYISFGPADHVGVDPDGFLLVRADRGAWRIPA